MADTNDSFQREVREELKREEYAEFWNKYGTYLIAAAAALIFGVAGFNFWKSSQLAASQKAGALYEQAALLAKDGKSDEAIKAFTALSDAAPGGYVGLAQLQLAGAQRKEGKTEDALKTYEQIVAAKNVDPLFRDYAKLQSAALQIGTADFTAIKNRLNDLTVEDNPFRFTARELVGLAAFQAGDMVEARKSYDSLIVDSAAPGGMTQRAEMMLARITEVELEKESAAAAKTAPAKDAKAADTKSTGAKDTAGDAAAKEDTPKDGAATGDKK